MPEGADPFRRLSSAERDRIARFVDRLARMPVELMVTLGARPLDPEAHAMALGSADVAARESLRTDAVMRIRADADEWVVRLYNRSTWQPGWYEANWGRPGTVGDRARLAISLAEALTALVLWDRLAEADRDELLGPFGTLLD